MKSLVTGVKSLTVCDQSGEKDFLKNNTNFKIFVIKTKKKNNKKKLLKLLKNFKK